MTTPHLPTHIKQLGPVLFIAVICFVFSLLGTSVIETGDYSRSHISAGEVWRLLSAHLFHTNFNHFLLNIAGLVLLWALHGDYYTPLRLVIVYLVSGLCVAAGIHFFTPELSRYVGLSGVLHGLFIWGALEDIRHNRKTGYLLVIGLAIKVAAEQSQGPDQQLGQWIDATVAIDAHLYGALAGFICYLFTLKTEALQTNKKGA